MGSRPLFVQIYVDIPYISARLLLPSPSKIQPTARTASVKAVTLPSASI